MNRSKKIVASLPFRILFAIGVPLLVISGAAFLYCYGNPMICVFHALTGLYCTGCGTGRAAYALLHFQFLKALDYNLLFVILAPLLAYYLLKQYLRIVLNKDVLPFFSVSCNAAIVVYCIIILFTILRNIPIYPFTILAP